MERVGAAPLPHQSLRPHRGCSLSLNIVSPPLFPPPASPPFPFFFSLLPSSHHAPCLDIDWIQMIIEEGICLKLETVSYCPHLGFWESPLEKGCRERNSYSREGLWILPRDWLPGPQEQGRAKPESESSTADHNESRLRLCWRESMTSCSEKPSEGGGHRLHPGLSAEGLTLCNSSGHPSPEDC